MKRGGELTRKTRLRAKTKPTYRTVVIDDRDSAAVEPFIALPKLPPIPTSLAKAARKVSRPKTTKARKAAKGMECQIRVPGVCERTNETVVLCHYRLAGTSGMGEKPHDSQAAYGCHACHDAVDGRREAHFSRTELRLMHAEGCFRTQAIIRAESAL